MFQRHVALSALAIILISACSGEDSQAPSVPDPITQTPPVSPPPPPPPTPQNNAPEFSISPTQSVIENLSWSIVVEATDPDGDDITYSMLESEDAQLFDFDFDSDTKRLSLREAQDFERPGDGDQDNVFNVTLTASDGEATSTLALKLSVLDQAEIFETSDSVLILGATPFGGLGANAMALGDLDQDGRPDLALAAPGQHTRDRISAFPPEDSKLGEVFFISGERLSVETTLSLADDLAAGLLHLQGADTDIHVGYSLLDIGDLDEDGHTDFAVARDETSLNLISGQTVSEAMQTGEVHHLEEMVTATITLSDDHFIDPHALAPMGDLNGDELPDLGLCIRRGFLNSSSRTHIVTAISGAALKDILTSGATRGLDDILAANLAGGYGQSGDVPYCGPITTIGDVDDDGLLDIAVPTSHYFRPGANIYRGAVMATAMVSGRIETSALTFASDPPHAEYVDEGVPSIWGDRVVAPLGDVTGDGVDDFGFSWLHFQDSANLDLNAAFIVKGRADALTANGTDPEKELRRLNSNGNAILLGAAPGAEKLTTIHAILPPQDGLHDPIILARYSEETVYTLLPDDLPTSGTAMISLPTSTTGELIIPERHRVNLSELFSIGDLNQDGYGDLAIGYATASPFTSAGRQSEAGAVWLISGKAILDARVSGETIDPRVDHPIP